MQAYTVKIATGLVLDHCPRNDGVNRCALLEEAGGAGLGLACQVLGCAYTALDDAVSAALALEVSLPLAMH